VIAGAFMTGSAFVMGVAMWRMLRRSGPDAAPFRIAAKVGAGALLVGGLAVLGSGDQLGQQIATEQPMKLAAAEGLQTTQTQAPFSVIGIWDLNGNEIFSIKVPAVLSILATHDPNGTVQGIDNLQAQFEAQYGPGNYSPIVPVTFWSFRFMIGAGGLAALAALWFLWKMRKGGLPSRGAILIAVVLPLLPLAANSFAWIFTEMGRQPWIVYGQQLTSQGVSPNVSAFEVGLTMIVFTLLYGALAAVEAGLLTKRIRGPLETKDDETTAADLPAPFAY
jgi:cytochrome d ubiquinol oxidase subunit I